MTKILQFRPAVIQPPACEVVVQRRTVRQALDWQQAIVGEARRYPHGSPDLVRYLKDSGLLPRCSFLSSEQNGGPLLFRFIGRPALDTLGEAWGRMVLGKPEVEDPHCDFSAAIAREYAEAIESGEAVVNEVSVTGIGRPFSFSHALVGWRQGQHRAILSAVKMHDVAGPRSLRPVETASDAA
ncbi:hypothetical protein [Azospirillum picis]|uniref:PAS domain-containing protein n=1 Tax=Azospirillum picis TaxID=488438 RepID=A0ABU0MRZ9_9PROT|nr:hypothetical protein [Azospirillum picis]MBP2302497.1 hypothetical protein [Azospirillum picis]MDQ0536261.1 hypothetical protein [Azospirillum picis]